jgi:hypothetical protein
LVPAAYQAARAARARPRARCGARDTLAAHLSPCSAALGPRLVRTQGPRGARGWVLSTR